MAIRKQTLLTLFTLSSTLLWGSNRIWEGTGSNNLWSNTDNWMNAVPVNGDSIGFQPGIPGEQFTSNNDLTNLALISISIGLMSPSPSTEFILTGNTLTMESSPALTLINGVHTFNIPLQLSSNLVVTLTEASISSIGGNISESVAGSTVTYTSGSAQNLNVSGTNTYTGGTSISGLLNLFLNNSASLPATGICTVGANASLALDGNGTYAGQISGSGDVIVGPQGGTVTLSNAGNNYTAQTEIVTNCTLIVTTSTLPSTGGCAFTSAGPGFPTLNFNQNTTGTYSGQIVGSGQVLISGGGNVTLSGTNTYNQGTTVAAATLTYGADTNVAGGPVTLGTTASDGPILKASGAFTTILPITLVATNSTIDPNGHTLLHMHPGGVTGTGGLLIGQPSSPAGTILSVDTGYTYTGGTTIVAGTLALQIAGSLPPPGPAPQGDITLQGSSTIFDISSGTSTTIGNLLGSPGSQVNLGGNNLVVTSSTFETFSGTILGSGGFLTKAGPATWALEGINSYTGGTIVTEGILELIGSSSIANASMAISSGATFDMSLTSTSPQTLSDLSGSGTLILGGNTLNYIQASNATTFGGTITSGGTGLLNIAAPGLPNAFSFTLTASSPLLLGPVTITSGTLAAGIANMFPNSGVMTVATMNSAFNLEGFNQTIGNLAGTSSPGAVNLQSATLTVGGNNQNSTYIGAIVGPGSLTKIGAGTLSLSGNLTFTNATVTQGKIAVTGTGTISASPLPSISIASGASYDVSAAIGMQGIGNLTGTGMLILGGATVDCVPSSAQDTYNGTITSTTGEFNLEAASNTLILTTPSPNLLGPLAITSGTLQAGASNLFPNANPLTVNGTFDINTTSQIINNFDGSSSGTVSLGTGGSITLGGNNMPLTLACSIVGTGEVIKTGSSTLNYSSPQSYSGGTLISSGTLTGSMDALPPHGTITVSSGAILATGGVMQIIGSLAGTGTVSFGATETLMVGQDGTATTFSGNFMGSGATLEINAPGNLTLAGLDAFFGASINTTIDPSATLDMGQSLALPPGTVTVNGTLATQGNDQIINTIAGNGSIVFSRNEMIELGGGTFAGQISGPGGVFIEGAVTYTGSNSYTNGTDIDMAGSSLTVSGSGTLPTTGIFNISSGTTLIIDVPSANIGTLQGLGTCNIAMMSGLADLSFQNSTYGGNFTGAGTFEHAGLSQLTLSGTSTGPISIIASLGSINVTGNYSTVPFDVGGAGLLKGTGSVGNIISVGTIAPGGSIGTLTAASYNGLGTLQIEVNPAGQSSVLAVTGALTLQPGSILVVVPDPGVYPPFITYTIATYGTESGTFTGATSTLFNRYKVVSIDYDPPGAITIVLGTTPFSNISSFPAAGCIESIPQGPGTDGAFVINTLNGTSNNLSDLDKAFAELEPKQYGALALAQENNDILIRSALTQRFYQRCKSNPPEPVEPTADGDIPQEMPQEPPIRKGTVWVEPVGKYANQTHQQQNLGYTAGTGGAVVGTDYLFGDYFYVGCGFGYTFTKLNWKESAGKADINSYYSSVYTTWFNKRAFIDATIITALNQYHADRKISLPGIHRTAHSHHRGYQVGTSLGSGVFFTPGHYQVTPYARLDYVFLHQNGFTESGAQSLDLKVDDTNSRYFRSDAGVKFAHCRRYDGVAVTPYIKASWVFEKQLDDAKFRSGFVHSPCKFSSYGLRPIRSLFAPSIGVTVLAYEDAFSFEFHDDFEIGKKFWENRVYLNFAYRF